jgi:hypothetical protein
LFKVARLGFTILAFSDEDPDVFDKIGSHRLNVLNNPSDVAEGCLRFLNEMIDGVFRGVAIVLTDFIASLSLPLRNLVDNMLEILFQSLNDNVPLGCLVSQRGKGLGLLFLKRHIDGAPSGLVILTLKDRWQRGFEVIDQLVYCGLKRPRRREVRWRSVCPGLQNC